MNLTKFSRPCSHFGIVIFEQEEEKRGTLCIKHGTLSIVSHYITLHHIGLCHIKWYSILSYYHTKLHHLISHPILSYFVLFYSILSYHITSNCNCAIDCSRAYFTGSGTGFSRASLLARISQRSYFPNLAHNSVL